MKQLLVVLMFSSSLLAMDVSKKVSLFLEECGHTESEGEAQALVAKACEHDRLATRTTPNGLLPIVAPWRDSYKTAERASGASSVVEKPKQKKCPFCDQFSRPDDDESNFILERNKHTVTMFNRNPYMPLHFLILPYRHIAEWNKLSAEERNELLARGVAWRAKLKELGVGGANFYFNLEHKAAGASLPDHVHGQLLSRWDGDRSAMTYLLGKTLIANERKMDGLLPEFYALAKASKSEKLARVFGAYASILKTSDGFSADDDCYPCEVEQGKKDDQHLVVKRAKHWTVALHRFGYAGGHLRITSRAHGTSLDRLGVEESDELADVMNQSQGVLKDLLAPDGLNMVINDGRCSDTPFEGHVMCDVVPRIINGTSSTAVICGRAIMEKDVDHLHGVLRDAFGADGD